MNDNQDFKKMNDDHIVSNKDSNIECRFYEKKYPETDDLVVV